MIYIENTTPLNRIFDWSDQLEQIREMLVDSQKDDEWRAADWLADLATEIRYSAGARFALGE